MFSVKPIYDIELQKELCDFLNTPYIPESIAYFAAELERDLTTIQSIIGICQFIPGEIGEILSLIPAPGKEDDEAMIIMERAVMSFLHRSGSKTFKMHESAGPDAVLKRSGLPFKDGFYTADLEVFFTSPCSYNKDN